VRLDRLDRIRVGDIYRGASPAEQAAMDDEIADALQKAERNKDIVAVERLAAVFGETNAAQPALDVLAKLYLDSGDLLKLERMQMRLEETQTTEAVEPAPTGDSASFTSSLTKAFDVSYRTEYVPDEINSGRPPSKPILPSFPMRVVGSVPSEFAGWDFVLSASAGTVAAFDPIGRERWNLRLNADGPYEPNVQGIGRAQVRFSGHLLAASAGSRVVMADATDPESPPAVLWHANLADRRLAPYYDQIQINRRAMSDPVDGPIGFAGAALFVYQAGSTVTAVEPISGAVVWRREGLPFNLEISGDEEFVTLQMPGGSGVAVLDAVDGHTVAERELPRTIARFGWIGTKVVLLHPANTAVELLCYDAARNEPVWSHRLGSFVAPLGSDEVAIVDSATSRLSVVRLRDGVVVLEADLERDPLLAEFGAIRQFGRLIVFTRRNEPAGRIRVETDRSRLPVDGLTYGFDEHGVRLWSAAIRKQYVDLCQPSGLPVLLLSAKRHTLGGQPSHHAALLDVRTGEQLIEQSRQTEFQPFEVQADAEAHSIEFSAKGGRFVLTQDDGPLPPPRTDGLAELTRDVAGNAPVGSP
jgi:hypothetical protein